MVAGSDVELGIVAACADAHGIVVTDEAHFAIGARDDFGAGAFDFNIVKRRVCDVTAACPLDEVWCTGLYLVNLLEVEVERAATGIEAGLMPGVLIFGVQFHDGGTSQC